MDLDRLQRAVDHARTTGDHRPLEELLTWSGWRRLEVTRTDILTNVEVNTVTGCWEWTGALDEAGYGVIGGKGAHRMSWEVFVGPIPKDHHVDHVCRVRHCVRPELDHLEPVTKAENNRRAMLVVQQAPDERVHNAAKRWCRRGHEYTETNTYRDKRGRRYCLACRRDWADEHRRRDGTPSRRYSERRVDEAAYVAARAALPPYVPGQPVVTLAEAAALLGYRSGATALQNWRRRHPGLLDPVTNDRPALYRLDEVEALLTCQTEHHWTKHERLYPSTASERQRR